MAVTQLGGQIGRKSVQLPSQPSGRQVSEAPVPTGHSQLQRPKTEERDSWARSSPGMCHPSR